MDQDDESDTIDLLALSFSQDAIINICKFDYHNFIQPTLGLDHSVIINANDNQQKNYN